MIRRTKPFFLLALTSAATTGLFACSSASDDPTASPANGTLTPSASFAPGQPLAYRAPAWATAAQFGGGVDPQTPIRAQVHLAMRNAGDAKTELEAISDPDSARYGQYLSDAEWNAKYAPTEADVALVRRRLESQGLSIVDVPANRAYLTVTGTAAQIEKAFSTRLGHYHVNGELRRAAMNAPTVSADIQAQVAGVLGLTTLRVSPHNVKLNGARTHEAFGNAAAALTCSEWWGSSTDTVDTTAYGPGYPSPLPVAQCGFKPANLREAYGFGQIVRKGNDGTGVSIAIVDAWQSPTLLQDAQTYFAQNDPDYPLDSAQFSAQMAPGTTQPPDTGWYDEQSLDVEAAHAMAPGAKIVYVGSQSSDDQDIVAALNLIITQRLASIVSNSYGSPELAEPQNYVLWENIAQQAGLKGIGLYFSSGDDGDEMDNLGFVSADFPASLATVTAVGGTSLALGSRGEIVFETGWESGRSVFEVPPVDGGADGGVADAGSSADAGVAIWDPPAPGAFRFGSGGGRSAIFPQPTYQAKVVPPAISNASVAAARVTPDIAMVGDPVTGFIIGETVDGTYTEYPIGGTSLSCPLFAGVMAVAQQSAGHRFGFVNPALYKANAKGAYRDVLPLGDKLAAAVRPGVVYTFDKQGLAIKTAKGYDDVTGMGVPNGNKFIAAVK